MGACGSKGGKNSGVLAMNNAELSNIQMKIGKRMMKHSNTSNQRIVSRQNITIKEVRDGPIDPYFYKEMSVEKGPFGLFGKRNNCAVFGCAYDIDQTSSFKVSSFSENILTEDENIMRDIESKMKQKAKTSLEGNPSGLAAFNRAINESKNLIKQNIKQKLENISRKQVGNEQNITIEYTSPPRCIDPCGLDGGTRGPKLSQNAQIEILSNDILNSSMKIVEDTMEKHGLDTKQTIKTSNDACILQMLGCIICSLMSMFIVWKVIKMGEQKMEMEM
jgi:hypothetical protein